MSEALPSWGEEVLPGVHLFRRTHNPHVALAKRAHDAMLSGAPVEMSINYEKIHEDLDSMKEMIERLEESNRFMRAYLAENEVDEEESQDGAEMKTADIHADDDNECVREALRENESIIKEKRKQLGDLLELTRLHYCSHDHNRLSGGHGCCEGAPAAPGVEQPVAGVAEASGTSDVPHSADENGDDDGDDDGDDNGDDDGDDNGDNEQDDAGAGFDDSNGGMCMGDLIAQRHYPLPPLAAEDQPATTAAAATDRQAFYL
jgi:hypothetical protein